LVSITAYFCAGAASAAKQKQRAARAIFFIRDFL
jgi:hypothetical protein